MYPDVARPLSLSTARAGRVGPRCLLKEPTPKESHKLARPSMGQAPQPGPTVPSGRGQDANREIPKPISDTGRKSHQPFPVGIRGWTGRNICVTLLRWRKRERSVQKEDAGTHATLAPLRGPNACGVRTAKRGCQACSWERGTDACTEEDFS